MERILVHLSESRFEADVIRFLFGDGEWVCTVYGEDLFG